MASECEAWEIAVIEKRQDRHQLFFEHCWLPELRFSLLFSTARPSSTGEKLVLYKPVRRSSEDTMPNCLVELG